MFKKICALLSRKPMEMQKLPEFPVKPTVVAKKKPAIKKATTRNFAAKPVAKPVIKKPAVKKTAPKKK